jgi:hypothetical protein
MAVVLRAATFNAIKVHERSCNRIEAKPNALRLLEHRPDQRAVETEVRSTWTRQERLPALD